MEKMRPSHTERWRWKDDWKMLKLLWLKGEISIVEKLEE